MNNLSSYKTLNKIELLLELHTLLPVLGISKITQLSKTKKVQIETFYKNVAAKEQKLIEKSAKNLFFKKIKPVSKFEKELRKVVSTYLKKVKKQ